MPGSTLRHVTLCAVAIFLLPSLASAEAQTGYGYKKGTDPLILGVKKIILRARRKQWAEVAAETKKLAWQFEEFRRDLDVDLEPAFQQAVQAQSLDRLAREISAVMYVALVQKFHWNRQERLKNFVRAKARVDAAREYYEQILGIGVRRFDARYGKGLNKEVLAAFTAMRTAIGSPGLFGFNSRPPDRKEFDKQAKAVLRPIEQVYRHVKGRTKKKSTAGSEGSRDAGKGS